MMLVALVILVSIPVVRLTEETQDDWDSINQTFVRQKCNLLDPLVYTKVAMFRGGKCYFVVANATVVANTNITAILDLNMTDVREQFERAQEICYAHKQSRLPSIHSEEEASFVMAAFKVFKDYDPTDYLKKPIEGVLLGLVPWSASPGGHAYVWNDGTNLTYRPEHWDNYWYGIAHMTTVYMTTIRHPWIGVKIAWRSQDERNIILPVGVLCKHTIPPKPTEAAQENPFSDDLHHPTSSSCQSNNIAMINYPGFAVLVAKVRLFLTAG